LGLVIPAIGNSCRNKLKPFRFRRSVTVTPVPSTFGGTFSPCSKQSLTA
jgi:hypothetical protein